MAFFRVTEFEGGQWRTRIRLYLHVLEKCKYLIHIHSIMSTSCVYTIRIPAEVRQMMDEMKDINWQSDIRQVVEDLVLERRRQKLLAEASEIRKGTKNIGVSASELIREDRDAR